MTMADAETKPKPEPPIVIEPEPEPEPPPVHDMLKRPALPTTGRQANHAMHAARLEARKKREAEVKRVFGTHRGRGAIY